MKPHEVDERIEEIVGWGGKYGLHVSDGYDSCSGTDEEAESKAKQAIKQLVFDVVTDVIGEDISVNLNSLNQYTENQLRAEQKKRRDSLLQ